MLVFQAITCFMVLVASGQAKEYRKLGAEYVPAESGKASLDEPSCEELRAMWRFSKRQSRAAEITNEIPQYRDPFVYNIWEPYSSGNGGIADGRSVGGVGMRTKSVVSVPLAGRRQRPVYGRIVHTPPPGVASLRALENSAPLRMRAFEEVARMFGSPRPSNAAIAPRKQYRYSGGGGDSSGIPVPQAGSFQQLKDLVRAERARELQQKYAEDQAAMADYGRIMHGPPPRDETTYGSLRYGRFEEPSPRGVLAFPDVLAPASRIEDYADQPLGFGSFEYPYASSGEMMHSSSEVEPVTSKAKHRSSVTKGRRVYTSRTAGAGSSYPLVENPRSMSLERGMRRR